MRVTIRCKDVMVLKSEDEGVAVILDEVNQNDLFNAFSMVEDLKLMTVEGKEPLELPEDFRIK